LRAIDGYDEGWPVIRLALKPVSLTLLRFSEFGLADWGEIEGLDGASPLWRVPENRMKMKKPHIVPLSKQAVVALRELQELTGGKGYMFPSPQQGHKPVTNNGVLFALYRMGYKNRMTMHGFRHCFSTLANEHGWNPDWIERQLAHEQKSQVRRAYNAAMYLDGRRQLMNWWGQFLEDQKARK
jgi:integrase